MEITYKTPSLRKISNYIIEQSYLPDSSVAHINEFIQTKIAISNVLPPESELANIVIDQADTYIDQTNTNDKIPLMLAPGATYKFLKKQGFNKKLSKEQLIYITYAIQQIIQEIICGCEHFLSEKKNNKWFISAKIVKETIEQDEALMELLHFDFKNP
eukprot:765467-Hanusia_phi.AAC.2